MQLYSDVTINDDNSSQLNMYSHSAIYLVCDDKSIPCIRPLYEKVRRDMTVAAAITSGRDQHGFERSRLVKVIPTLDIHKI